MSSSGIAIVGGGIAGLASAYYLERDGHQRITLFEAASRLGGKVRTDYVGDLLIEASADSVFSGKPQALELIQEVGLSEEVIGPSASSFSILVGGKLRTVPRGLLTFSRISREALDAASFLTVDAKRRAQMEGTIPGGTGEDESIASFFRRRFGEEFSKKVVEPMLAGTHGGLPESLSMKALYRTYLKQDRLFGSLSGAAMISTDERAPGPPFVSLKRGMGSLVEAIAKSLQHTEIIHRRITRLERLAGEYVIEGRTFNSVALAVPALEAADVLRQIAPLASCRLRGLKAASAAVITLAFDEPDLAGSLHGTGFLVPFDEPSMIAGATWSSAKWPGRAPGGTALVRVFMGREGVLDIDEHDDQALREIAQRALHEIWSRDAIPSYVRVQRWPRGLPQYEIGHMDRIEQIEGVLQQTPNIYLVGQAYRGVGISDCIRQARELAAKLSGVKAL